MAIIQLFISYKTGTDDGLTQAAYSIKNVLEAERDAKDERLYDVWMDETDLVPGQDWNTQIYEAISKTDIVLLLLSEASTRSDWVRREIDVARGAQVYILPVLIRGSFDVSAALEGFDLGRRQYVSFKKGDDAERAKLKETIDQCKNITRQRQEEWLQALREGRDKPVFKRGYEPVKKDYAVYTVPGVALPCKIYLAAGNIIDMRGIHVLVNTENNYMQMARVFETSTLSSRIRLYGSLMRGGNVREDTVQQELYDQITRSDDYPIPVAIGCVVPTHAGHPQSKLVKNGARYVFHVATVTVQPTQTNSFIPTDDEGIRLSVSNCLEKVEEVNRLRGVISPAGTKRRSDEEAAADSYEPIESIIFPLFATGRGGREREIRQVAHNIITAIRNFLLNGPDSATFSLSSIHVCAYSQLDVQLVKAEMDALLSPADA